MSWWLYWRVVRSVRWRTRVETCSRWVNMQIYSSFRYCSYCVPFSWLLCWRAVWCITTVEICSSEWTWQSLSLFITVAIVSRCPDDFTDGLGALCVGEPAWRLVLGEWTCKCISLFITVAIVSRFPDGFADGLCCGESPWRFVLGEWVNVQIDFSFHYTVAIVSRCPDGFTDGLCALCGGEPAWRLVLGEWTCKCISLFITVAIVSRFPDGFTDGLCGV